MNIISKYSGLPYCVVALVLVAMPLVVCAIAGQSQEKAPWKGLLTKGSAVTVQNDADGELTVLRPLIGYYASKMRDGRTNEVVAPGASVDIPWGEFCAWTGLTRTASLQCIVEVVPVAWHPKMVKHDGTYLAEHTRSLLARLFGAPDTSYADTVAVREDAGTQDCPFGIVRVWGRNGVYNIAPQQAGSIDNLLRVGKCRSGA